MTSPLQDVADYGAADAHLVARVLGGDRNAYGSLVRRHQLSIYRLCRGMGIDHDASLDLVQDAFVKAYERLSECREATHYRAWLYRICRNMCLDRLRAGERSAIPFSHLEDADAIEGPHAQPSDLGLTMDTALQRLPLALREAFLLKHDAGYTYEEVAQLTETSPSAAKMRVHRAREALRVFLAKQGVAA